MEGEFSQRYSICTMPGNVGVNLSLTLVYMRSDPFIIFSHYFQHRTMSSVYNESSFKLVISVTLSGII